METLAAYELVERINEILRRVEEDGETFEVTNHGEVYIFHSADVIMMRRKASTGSIM